MKRCMYVQLRSVSIGVLLNTTLLDSSHWTLRPGIYRGGSIFEITFPKLKNLAGDKGRGSLENKYTS